MRRPPSPVGSSVLAVVRRRTTASTDAYAQEWVRPTPYEAVARQVIALRASHSMSQDELAARVGTSHSQISRIESGQHRPSMETLRRIAEAFDADLVISFEPRAVA